MRSWLGSGVVAAIVFAGLGTSAAAAAGLPSGVTPDIPTGGHPPVIRSFAGGANLDWQGGPVMHKNRAHVIFWNPSNKSLTWAAGYQALITGFLANVAADSHKATNVYALSGQYGDATGRAFYDTTFAGAVQDTDPAPANGCALPPAAPAWSVCLTDAQIRSELSTYIANHSLPDTMTDLYFLVTPEGLGSCFQTGPSDCSLGGSANAGFCGYHSFFGSSGASPGLYANIPFNDEAGHCQSGNPKPNNNPADTSLSTLSHEHMEAITDPLPAGAGNPQTGWVDSNSASPTFQEEIGDLCAGSYGSPLGTTASGAYNETIGSGHYVLQEEWSNEDAGGSCQQRDEADSVSVSSPSSAVIGVPVSFGGSGADPDGSVTGFVWSFGDGSSPSFGAHVTHVFGHAGRFTVTLTMQDRTGQRASVSRSIDIVAGAITKVSAKVGRHKASLSVSVSGAGTVRVGGARQSLSRAGTATFTVMLGAAGRAKLSHKGVQKVRRRVVVRFTPPGGGTETKTVSITFRG